MSLLNSFAASLSVSCCFNFQMSVVVLLLKCLYSEVFVVIIFEETFTLSNCYFLLC